MRDQYAGDVSDYLKFAFLRAVASEYGSLGIGWYYVPGHDGRSDGRHTEYLAEPAWRQLDALLYNALGKLRQRKVTSLERLTFWPKGTVFHRTPVASLSRNDWVKAMALALEKPNLVFLDPDNGLGKHRTKHARITDLVALKRPRRALAIIKFPGRHATHATQIANLHQQLVDAGFRSPITVSTCVQIVSQTGRTVPRHRFFTLVDATAAARQQVLNFADRLNELDRTTRVTAHMVT